MFIYNIHNHSGNMLKPAGKTPEITFHEIRDTEFQLLKSICAFQAHEDYTVYKSEAYPGYYAGNGIEILHNNGKQLRHWETVFGEYFDRKISKHLTFTFERNQDTEVLIGAAKDKNYHVEMNAYMAVDSTEQVCLIPDTYQVKQIESVEDWQRFEVFYDEVSREYDWYDPEYGTRELFAKTRKTSEELDIQWFYIGPENTSEIWGKLGIFQHENMFRLQDIMVHPDHRRKKLATYLLSYAMKLVLDTNRGKGLALIADTEYHAITLYHQLGFRKYGECICMMHYPV